MPEGWLLHLFLGDRDIARSEILMQMRIVIIKEQGVMRKMQSQ